MNNDISKDMTIKKNFMQSFDLNDFIYILKDSDNRGYGIKFVLSEKTIYYRKDWFMHNTTVINSFFAFQKVPIFSNQYLFKNCVEYRSLSTMTIHIMELLGSNTIHFHESDMYDIIVDHKKIQSKLKQYIQKSILDIKKYVFNHFKQCYDTMIEDFNANELLFLKRVRKFNLSKRNSAGQFMIQNIRYEQLADTCPFLVQFCIDSSSDDHSIKLLQKSVKDAVYDGEPLKYILRDVLGLTPSIRKYNATISRWFLVAYMQTLHHKSLGHDTTIFDQQLIGITLNNLPHYQRVNMMSLITSLIQWAYTRVESQYYLLFNYLMKKNIAAIFEKTKSVDSSTIIFKDIFFQIVNKLSEKLTNGNPKKEIEEICDRLLGSANAYPLSNYVYDSPWIPSGKFDNIQIVPLETTQSIRENGKKMNLCTKDSDSLSIFHYRIINGESYLYEILNIQGKCLATLELGRVGDFFYIKQLKGVNNKKVLGSTLRVVYRWIIDFSMNNDIDSSNTIL